MGLTDLSFTPTEYILLNGDKFAPESGGPNKLALLCSDGFVDGATLAKLICVGAILANEEEGALTLNLEQSKKIFGLKETTRLVIRPTGRPSNWNGFTLETAILFVCTQAYAVPGDYSVKNIIYNIVAEDRPRPWEKIVELVEGGLASSNWLMPVSGDAAAAFLTPYICPAKVRDLALAQPAAPVMNLLMNCKKVRPEIWNQLTGEINTAFEERITD